VIDLAGVGDGEGDPSSFTPADAMETVHEVAVYIDRFHNLDLILQG
jgi:hypothetical protein